MGTFRDVDGNNPLETIAGGAAEEQLRLEVFVLQEPLEQGFNIRYVVEIDADKAGVFHQILVVSRGKCAGEAGVIESLGLETLGFLLVCHRPEFLRALFGVVAGDVLVDVNDIRTATWLQIADGGAEEGERLDFDGLFLRLVGGEVLHLGVFANRVETALLADMKEHFLIESLQQLITFLMIVEGGEAECVTFRYCFVQVLMQGPLCR